MNPDDYQRQGPTGERREPARRRFFQLAGGGVLMGWLARAVSDLSFPESAFAESVLRLDAALKELMEGNKRFTTDSMTSYEHDLAILKEHTSEKQEPFAAVLSCADSRVPVELIFDQSIGHNLRHTRGGKCHHAGNRCQSRIWRGGVGHESAASHGTRQLRRGQGRDPGQRRSRTNQRAISAHSAWGQSRQGAT